MMSSSHRPPGPVRVGISVLLLCLICTQLAIGFPAYADAGGTPAYIFNFDSSNMEDIGGGEHLLVTSDWQIRAGETLSFAGWLATEAGVESYRYAFVPTDDEMGVGSVTWQTPRVLTITARPDLKQAGIAYSSGHDSAGFALELDAPDDADGTYDFYLRGVTKSGGCCDLLVVLNVTVGEPDLDDGDIRTIHMGRVARQAAGLPGVSAAADGALTLTAEAVVPLGQINLAGFEQVTITYKTGSDFTAGKGSRRAALGFKLVPPGTEAPAPYRTEDGLYDLGDSQIMGLLSAGTGERTLTLDLAEVADWGELYLSAYLFGSDSVTVTGITLTHNGSSDSRTAARILFSGDLAPYFSSYNRVTAETVSDSALGDILRVQATENTNDPYVYFNAEALLREHDLRMNADEYRYMVVLARARQGNASGHMTFYLCAGDIHSPTEQCTVSQTLRTDGQWHYYLLDLSDKATWAGTIHGWRIDMINGNTAAGDWVDYASVQLFRTREAAEAVAAGDPLNPDSIYRTGEIPVVRDDREEGAATTPGVFVPAAGDVYLPPEPETETETEIETISETEPETESDTAPDTNPDTETDPVPETDPNTSPDTVPETDPNTEPDTDPETDPNTEPDTDPETDPNTETETDPETDPDTVPDTVPDTSSDTETDPVPETEPETETDTDPNTSPNTSPDTNPPTAPESPSGCSSTLGGGGWILLALMALCGGLYSVKSLYHERK